MKQAQDRVAQEYKEAYEKANGSKVKVRKITCVRYTIDGGLSEFTAKQMRGFTKGLEDRARK